MANYLYKPTASLVNFSKQDAWTLNDAYMGTFICGGTGSGKSSGSGRTLAHSFLRAGFGGLVLCNKPDEANTWRKYAQETKRENSLIVLDGKGGKRFNFIDYELARIDGGSNKTPFALDALLKIYEAMQAFDGTKGDESFWKNSVRLLLSHSIEALYTAYGNIRFPELMNFINSAAISDEQYRSEEWRKNSFHYLTMKEAATNAVSAEQRSDLQAVGRYFIGFYVLDNKTKSNIKATLEAMLMDFQKGDLARIFCTTTNVVPDLSHHGAVIVLDFPLKIWQRGGLIAQHLFKFAWAKAVERRAINETTRPCFLWADEYQAFISSYDAEFQATARSSRVCTVYMTQSISALREAIKSSVPKESVDSLLNNFQTKIIHTCTDPTTQIWAAELIGKGIQIRNTTSYNTSQGTNYGQSMGSSSGHSSGYSAATGDGISSNSGGGWHDGENGNHGSGSNGRGRNRSYTHSDNTGTSEGFNHGVSTGNNQGTSEGLSYQETMDYHIQPSFFGAALRMGGEKNKFEVDGVVMQGGRTWSYNNSTWLVCRFSQK